MEMHNRKAQQLVRSGQHTANYEFPRIKLKRNGENLHDIVS